MKKDLKSFTWAQMLSLITSLRGRQTKGYFVVVILISWW